MSFESLNDASWRLKVLDHLPEQSGDRAFSLGQDWYSQTVEVEEDVEVIHIHSKLSD